MSLEAVIIMLKIGHAAGVIILDRGGIGYGLCEPLCKVEAVTIHLVLTDPMVKGAPDEVACSR